MLLMVPLFIFVNATQNFFLDVKKNDDATHDHESSGNCLTRGCIKGD